MKRTLEHDDRKEIRELLMGRTVKIVGAGKLELDDGTILTLHGNEGCGGCGNGWYELTELNDCPNVITNVDFDSNSGVGDWDGEHHWFGYYKIFVFADHQKINLATFEGTDGNGYYGTGYWIEIEGTKPRD